jgi:hypothetical protein
MIIRVKLALHHAGVSQQRLQRRLATTRMYLRSLRNPLNGVPVLSFSEQLAVINV